MDSIKPNGWIQLVRERQGRSETILSEKNTINPDYFTALFYSLTNRKNGIDNGRVPQQLCDSYQIDGIVCGSYSGINGDRSLWATWAGTFSFGSNANFSNFVSNALGENLVATFYGTFNFSGNHYINYLNLGCGSTLLYPDNGDYEDTLIPSCTMLQKILTGTSIGTFINGDILRVNWVLKFA
jgi:hypothetical protein